MLLNWYYYGYVVLGSGHERGGLITVISNSYHDTSALVSLLDMTPWYLRLLYHTLELNCQQRMGSSVKDCMEGLGKHSFSALIVYYTYATVLAHRYSPARDRKLPYTMEYLFLLPP